jgi:nitroreductase
MEVFEAVRTVLAVREFQDKAVPPESVRRIVEAGRLSGSSMNRQPWHFIVVQNRESLRQLGALRKPDRTSPRRLWRLSSLLRERRSRFQMAAARSNR